jgi:hypothetical protein
VGHSKGGLYARAYLGTDTNKVANLIMIGTPDAGSLAVFGMAQIVMLGLLEIYYRGLKPLRSTIKQRILTISQLQETGYQMSGVLRTGMDTR